MSQYKLSKIWIAIAISSFIVSIVLTAIFQSARWNSIPLVASVIMLILFIPVLIIDIKKASGEKKVKKEETKKMELKQAEIELEKERLEVEKLKLQQGIIEEAKNHCQYCGAAIVGNPEICPKCGVTLTE